MVGVPVMQQILPRYGNTRLLHGHKYHVNERQFLACRLQRQVDKADPPLRSALHPFGLTWFCLAC